ncbi:MAG TPA: ribulose-phosphate 3-epimerase [Candidatus Limnocylindrales bacterium]|nr:ribulose-phosphate 3-epimerase [Candidatus Limnocylindrales bacterium]
MKRRPAPAPDAPWSGTGRFRICPSILSADFSRLAEEIADVEAAGADFIHVDVMDGQFVPNLTFGPIVVGGIRKWTRLPLDVHLMIADPLRHLPAFADAGANHLIVHVEAVDDPEAAARAIRARGLRAGLAIKPSTPLDRLARALSQCDTALVMTVEPGAGGQPFLPGSPDRIAAIRRAIDAGGFDCLLGVDGGIDARTAPIAAEAGADSFVAGNSIFHAPDPPAALRAIRASLRGR